MHKRISLTVRGEALDSFKNHTSSGFSAQKNKTKNKTIFKWGKMRQTLKMDASISWL